MKKRMIACVFALVLLVGVMCAPMAASATTVDDVYNYFLTMPMADQYKDDVQKLMGVVPVTDDQAAQLLDYLKKVNTIADASKGNDPRNYTREEVQQVLEWVQAACAVVNVEVKFTTRTDADRVNPADHMILEFFYEGKKIYEYDGDAVSKTGSDISSAALFGGFTLLATAAVVVVAAKKKIAE